MNQNIENVFKKANEEALYNVFMYVMHLCEIEKCKTVNDAIANLKNKYDTLSQRDKRRYSILSNGIRSNPDVGLSEIRSSVISPDGLTASAFIKPNGDISVVFRGTGNGEWIDNGEGLSGIPESNTYITYAVGGKEIHRQNAKDDYATDRQVQALNYFSKTLAENMILRQSAVTVSGHSKGGNKAQFIAICSDIPTTCYSFSGQGFSPEAISDFKNKYGSKFEQRCRNILSFSAENDYVNVLGKRVMPESNIYYLKSSGGLHFPESILNQNGALNPQVRQGILSEYIQSVSDELMNLKPFLRRHATVGIMNIFGKYLGNNAQADSEVSLKRTITGIAMTFGAMMKKFNVLNKNHPLL